MFCLHNSTSLLELLKQTFPPIIWILTEGEGDGIESRLFSQTFSTLPLNLVTFSKKVIHKKILPSGQMHSKEPISFLHSPPRHNPGMASHSLISMHFPVWTFFKNPGWQDNFSGQLSQGCPQALPIVAQQSCFVQTTPSNCPVHISFSMRLFGAIHKWCYHFSRKGWGAHRGPEQPIM